MKGQNNLKEHVNQETFLEKVTMVLLEKITRVLVLMYVLYRLGYGLGTFLAHIGL